MTKIFEEFNGDYDASKNVTLNIMTRYEKAKVVGMRMEQNARGANILVQPKSKNIRDIAFQELEERKLPFVIVRKLPNGEKEHWKLKYLIIV
jgi:DNA-directed RNA polymerase subunit K/omega